jgi:hypothetical protein
MITGFWLRTTLAPLNILRDDRRQGREASLPCRTVP